ncbi:hypothetical protein UAW_02617 [Enterococcus haemoperoxidus ATCC BAA-382]|uniref:Uroporphyrinogen-III synthase n=1 Tax=Enterococcus haemoperoxidus ATCC BAA-382 TaxID=1158608 RepID=R2SZB4_9ENTE|nr:uroporphyrinogen-III synthase [Enterococcus haemoperoxidus]EOH93369.1 hypothetical protein UAW_02617 [Enterococcus haemoperoxidus ATCC BAA-382]EOT61323.1 hypothetical protein I583_00301 [Enterococcus haemoperoxidus ATCC BAA-382]
MKKILLTRLPEDNCEDCLYFQKRGFETVEIPLLTLKKRAVEHSFESLVKQSEWVFLTSQHAAAFFFQQLRKKEFETKKFAVIGEKTAQILLTNNVVVTFQAPYPTKKHLFEAFAACYLEPTTILYPKSNLADNAGEAGLVAEGHQLFSPILYDNYFPKKNQQLLKEALLTQKITAVYLASPSLWHRFLAVYRKTDLKEMPKLYCLGQTTRQAIIKDGFTATLRNEA